MSEVRLNLRTGCTRDEIAAEIKSLRQQIDPRRSQIAEIQGEISTLMLGVKHYQRQCKHEGQETGHNERDGSWGNPCPTCGYSY